MKLVIIKTELDLAITYSKIAQESDNEEKIAKHRASARKAYDLRSKWTLKNWVKTSNQTCFTYSCHFSQDRLHRLPGFYPSEE
jgi:hypothetical protein